MIRGKSPSKTRYLTPLVKSYTTVSGNTYCIFSSLLECSLTPTGTIVIFDGHGSHHTSQFSQFCPDNHILTFCMPLYSSHILQPLDVTCFGPLKRAYGA